MSYFIVSSDELNDIADAIRAKGETSDPLEFPGGFTDAIDAIQGGGSVPTGTKQISIGSNGTTTENVESYASAEIIVSVPNTYTQSDEGKVVSNGALVSQGSDTVTENGTVDTTLISSLLVSVSGGGGQSMTKLASGIYTKTDQSTKNTVVEIPLNVSGRIAQAFIIAETPVSGTNQTIGWFGYFDIPQDVKDAINTITYVSRGIRYSDTGVYSAVDARCELTNSGALLVGQQTNTANHVLNNDYSWEVWGYAT